MINLTNIEITTIITVALLILFGILTYTKKMTVGIALISLLGGIVVAWLFASYNQLVISAFSNAIWYNYPWTLFAVLGLLHMLSMFGLVIMAGYNLYISEGKVIWA